jgi:hypothetical protein
MGLEKVDSYKYLGVQLYAKADVKQYKKELKNRTMKAIGAIAHKATKLHISTRKMLLAAYIRCIYEYIMKPLVLSRNIKLREAAKWENIAIKAFMSLPNNASDAAIILLTNINSMANIKSRAKQIKCRIIELNPIWLSFENKQLLLQSWNEIENEYSAYLYKSPIIKVSVQFKEMSIIIPKDGKVISGEVISNMIYKRLSNDWDYLMTLYNLLFRPLWFKDKKRLQCTKCNRQWGYQHISECELLKAHRTTIEQWKAKGFQQLEYYFRKDMLTCDIGLLQKANQIIQRNSIAINEHL